MAALTIYDLLIHLVNNIAWRDDSQRVAALDSIAEYRQVNLFGQMAIVVGCPHERTMQKYQGPVSCQDCGLLL